MTIGTVYTGFGFWNVYAWMMFFALGALIVLCIRSTGRSDYEKAHTRTRYFTVATLFRKWARFGRSSQLFLLGVY